MLGATKTTEDRLEEAFALMKVQQKKIIRMQEEIETSDTLIFEMDEILNRSVNVLKGKPPEQQRWPYENLPVLIAKVMD